MSLQVNYSHAAEFRNAGYTPFVIEGTEYDAVREKANFGSVKVYESGHLVPFSQHK